MTSAPPPENENQRLAALQRYEILDTLPEQSYDDITLLASRICGTPIAVVSLVDSDRQWFKSKVGLEATQTPRSVAFCAHAILRPGELLEVPDASEDDRFCANPLVTDDPHIRFYAGAPLVDPEGQALGTLCVIDREPGALSEEQRESLSALARQVMSQLELRAYVAQLQQRTRELDAARLQQLELKDQLLRHVSHELRTPLAALHQFLSLVLDGIGDLEEQRQYLELAFKSAEQLKRMISDLLEVARAESGKLRVEPTLLAPSPLLRDAVETLRGRASAAGIALEAELPDDLPMVLADEGRTRQVLQNLIDNAIKFTPEGGRITVSARVDADEPDCVRCSVVDTGSGIAEDSLRAIFEQFHQLPDPQARSREGLGIGLAICSCLVARMGGRIWVESKLGAGSSFHFTLPVFRLEELVQRASGPEASDGGSARFDGVGLVRVGLRQPDGSPAQLTDSRRRQLQHLLKGLLFYPNFDQILPALGPGSEHGAPQHLLVGMQAEDLGALLRRLHDHLRCDPELRRWELCPAVEGVWLPNSGPPNGSSEVAARIAALVRTEHWEGGIPTWQTARS